MTIIAQIDLRADHGPARDQGSRPTCLAFAMSDLNGQRNRQPASLSAEYLYRDAALRMPGWRPHDGLEVRAALAAANAPGQALEAHCPYLPIEPSVPLTPNAACAPLYAGAYTRQTSAMHHIIGALSSGRSIGLVVNVTPEFYLVDAGTAQISYSPNVMPGLSHAVVAVGLGRHRTTGEPHVLIRNSWGASWGDSGHAWLPEKYVAVHALCSFGD